MTQVDLAQLDLKIRAQLLRDIFARIERLLEIHFSGDLLVLSEQVDEAYIRLSKTLELLLKTPGLEQLQKALPCELPGTLHSVDPVIADEDWEWAIHPAVNTYKGALIEFCVEVEAGYPDNAFPFREILEPYDRLLAGFQQEKRRVTQNFWARAERQAQAFRDRAEGKPIHSLPAQDWSFVQDEQLRAMLARDYAELGEVLKVQAPKSAIVLCGSLLEAVLVATLQRQEQAACDKYHELFLRANHPARQSPPLQEWKLHQLITVAAELGILDDDSRRHADLLRDYRNLIHLMVEMRRRSNVDQDIVTSLLALLRRVLRLLSSQDT